MNLEIVVDPFDLNDLMIDMYSEQNVPVFILLMKKVKNTLCPIMPFFILRLTDYAKWTMDYFSAR